MFHFGSFALGYAAGVSTAVLAPRLRRLGLALATAGFRMVDALAVRAAQKREDLEDLLAEAKARARGVHGGTEPS
jgi:hypothetical protein